MYKVKVGKTIYKDKEGKDKFDYLDAIQHANKLRFCVQDVSLERV